MGAASGAAGLLPRVDRPRAHTGSAGAHQTGAAADRHAARERARRERMGRLRGGHAGGQARRSLAETRRDRDRALCLGSRHRTQRVLHIFRHALRRPRRGRAWDGELLPGEQEPDRGLFPSRATRDGVRLHASSLAFWLLVGDGGWRSADLMDWLANDLHRARDPANPSCGAGSPDRTQRERVCGPTSSY